MPDLELCLRQLIKQGVPKAFALKQFGSLYSLYGDEAFRAGLKVAIEQEKHHPEQLSNILILRTKTNQNHLKPVHFSKDNQFEKLHVDSHSLDNYDHI